MLKTLTILIALAVTSCNLLSYQDYEGASSPGNSLFEEVIQLCTDIKRPLNPSSEPTSSESELDRHFRLAFDYETAGDFDLAIFHYQNAAQLSQCDCDRLHAQAGEKAAKEAQDLWEKEGMAAKPTQYFWGRLQQLTETLPCVEISYE
ncbi:MAG: hypothetical protein WBM32_10380 [Crocosphaera sp.]